MAQAPIIVGQLPLNYCWPSNPQTFLNDVAQIIYASVQDNITGVVYGPVAPTETALYKLWFNTNFHRLYEWNSTYGFWTSIYFLGINSPWKLIWESTPEALAALDNPGGYVGQAVSEFSGPFWEIDHNYDGRSVMAPGDISGEMSPIKTLALSENYGTGSHIQLPTEIAQHTHRVEFSDATPGAVYAHIESGDTPPLSGQLKDAIGTGAGSNQADMIAVASATVPTAMQNVHPVRGAPLAKRTGRVFYTFP